MAIKVKICGITNYEDALLAANLGADYVGFNFYKDSPRKISIKLAKEIISKLPHFVTPAGIFVNEDLDVVLKTVKKCGIKLIQLHGNENPDYCAEIFAKSAIPIIKSFRVSDEKSLEPISSYINTVNYFLLDAYVAGVEGGTGEVFNWDLAVKVKELNKPIFLAGGLTYENVTTAIEKVLPFCVDVASGVERLPRRKDFEKMKLFIRSARGL